MAVEGIRGVQIDLHEDVAGELEKRAASMGFLLDEYCTSVLAHWTKADVKLSITEK